MLSRMFGPYYGIKEENATGMASGLLGGWLHHRSAGTIRKIFIEQDPSVMMKEKGFLQVEIETINNEKTVRVGGDAVIKNVADLSFALN